MDQLSVYIISAFPIISEGLKTFLMSEEIINICGCLNDFGSLTKVLIENRPDIFLIDDVYFDLTILKECIQTLSIYLASARIIIYTGSNNPLYLKVLLNSNVNGIVHKGSSKEELIEAIKLVSQSNVYVDKQISYLLYNFELKLKTLGSKYLSQLSNREVEVLEYVCEKLTNKEIALRLNRSVKTVEKHIENIKFKLGKDSVEELRSFLREKKLLY